MSNYLVSFIMPTYNSEEYIIRTLKSFDEMVGNKRKQIELLCIDDGSADQTLNKIKEFAKNVGYVKYESLSHGGVSTVRNHGLDIAQGEYVSFIDSDDFYQKDFLDRFFEQVERYNHPDLLIEDVKGINLDFYKNNLNEENRISILNVIYRIGETTAETGVASKFIRKDVIDRANISYLPIPVSEDVLFNVNVINNIKSIVISGEKYYLVQESHTLAFYNRENKDGQLRYLAGLSKILNHYGGLENDIIDLAYQKVLNIMIEKYYGPLCASKKLSFGVAANELKKIVKRQGFYNHLNNQRVSIVSGNNGFRYKTFRFLITKGLFKACLFFDVILDKIKGYERFK